MLVVKLEKFLHTRNDRTPLLLYQQDGGFFFVAVFDDEKTVLVLKRGAGYFSHMTQVQLYRKDQETMATGILRRVYKDLSTMHERKGGA
jgi:hypothetical protein